MVLLDTLIDHKVISFNEVYFNLIPATTLKSGGNVLVPCNPSGVTYDMFELLSIHMDKMGLAHVPLYFVSPVANNSLAYSNICAEW